MPSALRAVAPRQAWGARRPGEAAPRDGLGDWGQKRGSVDPAKFAREFSQSMEAGLRGAASNRPRGDGLRRGGPGVSMIANEMGKFTENGDGVLWALNLRAVSG